MKKRKRISFYFGPSNVMSVRVRPWMHFKISKLAEKRKVNVSDVILEALQEYWASCLERKILNKKQVDGWLDEYKKESPHAVD
jgi:predicted transcriptional regulator